MAIDLKNMDKKKIGIVIVALIAGLGAVALMNTHINTTVQGMSHSEEIQQMAQRLEKVEGYNKQLYQSQQEMQRQLEQRLKELQAPRVVSPSTTEQPRQSLALRTPEGKRALTLKIQTLEAVGGLLNPGDFVDILAHLNVPSSEKPEEISKTILTLFQSIQILAIGSNVDQLSDFAEQQSTGALPITLAVDPQQAELLTFAEKHGKLQLVLRSPAEKDAYKLGPTNWATFSKYLSDTQGIKLDVPMPTEAGEPAPKPKAKPKVEIIRGGQ